MPDEQLELTDIQGIVARGYGGLAAGRFVLLRLGGASEARSWLGKLADDITPASERPGTAAVQVAFGREGLERLGVPADALASFSPEFREGMTATHRQRSLGDAGDDAPAQWRWGGTKDGNVDAVLLLYARDEESMAPLLTTQTANAEAAGIEVAHVLATSEVVDREPFGFRDGISQPWIGGLGSGGAPANTVRAGEFVLGYRNEYGLYTDVPSAPVASDPSAALAPVPGETSQRALGKNGSYLVFRQLEQDVSGFWRHLDSLTRDTDGAAKETQRELLAAKMVGRWPSGAPLVEAPYHDDPAFATTNDFGYHERDADGLRCPVGAHVRRANPRDSLDPDPGTAASYAINKRHRLLRRGRPYGSELSVERALAGEDDGTERGLHFVCICANIARQFEFVQQTWLNNPKFGALHEDVDPILGPRGAEGATFRVPAEPVRRRYTGLPSFVRVRGGGYFFLPGLRALQYLAALR